MQFKVSLNYHEISKATLTGGSWDFILYALPMLPNSSILFATTFFIAAIS